MSDGGDMDIIIGDNAAGGGIAPLPPPSGAQQQLRQLYHQLHHLHHRAPGLDDGVRMMRMIEDRQEAFDRVLEELDLARRAAASAAAVAGLEKQTFHAADGGGGGGTECAICLNGFDDGEEVTVMPCFHGHGFHPDCIAMWLGRSNRCPLCRHQLPTDLDDQ